MRTPNLAALLLLLMVPGGLPGRTDVAGDTLTIKAGGKSPQIRHPAACPNRWSGNDGATAIPQRRPALGGDARPGKPPACLRVRGGFRSPIG
jgi:hypothetical protein